MKLYEIIAGAQGGQAIANLAQAARIEPERLDAAIRAVLPEFTNGLERNTLSRGGLADLVAALGDGHHEVILDNPAAITDPRVVADGNEILGHVLGSKDRSRAVALQAAQASGLSDGLIRMLMPYIAQMVMGAIAKWAKGGLGDVIQKLPGAQGGGLPMPQGAPGRRNRRSQDDNQDSGQTSGQGGGQNGNMGGGFELPRAEIPQGGFPMLPMPGSSTTTPTRQRQDDDQGGGGGGFQIPWPRPQGGATTGSGRSPFPFPFPQQQQSQDDSGNTSDGGGFQIPWPRQPQQPQPQRRSSGGGGFDLPQAGRPEGGFPIPPMPGSTNAGAGNSPLPLPGGAGGNNPYGDLSDILRRGAKIGGSPSGGLVRSILGGLLGFGGRGLFGWFMRLIVMRFGWGLLKRVLGRAVTGR